MLWHRMLNETKPCEWEEEAAKLKEPQIFLIIQYRIIFIWLTIKHDQNTYSMSDTPEHGLLNGQGV